MEINNMEAIDNLEEAAKGGFINLPQGQGTITSISLNTDGSSGDRNLEVTVARAMQEYFELWKQKQRSYGPHNIGAFGAAGCLIRANDKIQRLRRHYFLNKNVALADESIEDTWKDMMGYALMGLVCHRGQWPGLE